MPFKRPSREEDPRYRRNALRIWLLVNAGLSGRKAAQMVYPQRHLRPAQASKYASECCRFVEEHQLDDDLRKTFSAHLVNAPLIAQRVKEGLDATRSYVTEVNGKQRIKTVPDYPVRLSYCQFAYNVLVPKENRQEKPATQVLVMNRVADQPLDTTKRRSVRGKPVLVNIGDASTIKDLTDNPTP